MSSMLNDKLRMQIEASNLKGSYCETALEAVRAVEKQEAEEVAAINWLECTDNII